MFIRSMHMQILHVVCILLICISCVWYKEWMRTYIVYNVRICVVYEFCFMERIYTNIMYAVCVCCTKWCLYEVCICKSDCRQFKHVVYTMFVSIVHIWMCICIQFVYCVVPSVFIQRAHFIILYIICVCYILCLCG